MENPKADAQAIEEITGELYASICFEEGGQPPVEKLRDLFVPWGHLVNNNGDEPAVMPVDDFIGAYQQALSGGSIKSFYEGELSSRTELFGKIAHRFSTYEAKFDLAKAEPFSVGINSIQFIKTAGKWRVTCMVWNDQTDDLRIPGEYL